MILRYSMHAEQVRSMILPTENPEGYWVRHMDVAELLRRIDLCIKHQRDGYDVLASKAWDDLVAFREATPQPDPDTDATIAVRKDQMPVKQT